MDDPVPVAQLAALVGAEHVATDEEARAAASSSWYPVETKQRQAGGVPPRRVRAVISPGTAEEVAALVRWANETGTPLIPVGGGSNTVGSTHPGFGGIAVRMTRLQGLHRDEDALLVRAGAGWNLGALEENLNARGYTLGHLPHSLNLVTVGGSVATNAIGVLSGRYGRQADLTLALEAVLPTGEIVHLPSVPGTPAGPDLSRLFLGSEGALGIVTEATLRLWPLPDVRAWAVFTFPDFYQGLDALRLVHRTDARPAAVRLFDPAAAQDLAARHGLARTEALLLLAFEGDELPQTGQYQMAHAVCRRAGGTEGAGEIGERWFEERLQTTWMSPNARPGGLADVIAVSAPWSRARALYDRLRAALAPLVGQLQVQVGHAGATGAALDVTFQARAEPATPEAAIALHRRIREAAAGATREAGGSLAHHYGIGLAWRDLLEAGTGAGQMALLRRIKSALDPNGILNPGGWGRERP